MDFMVTNFEPWTTSLLYDKMQQSEDFKEIMNQYQVGQSDLLNVSKILDLQAFGNTIIEFLVGKCTEKDANINNANKES